MAAVMYAVALAPIPHSPLDRAKTLRQKPCGLVARLNFRPHFDGTHMLLREALADSDFLTRP